MPCGTEARSLAWIGKIRLTQLVQSRLHLERASQNVPLSVSTNRLGYNPAKASWQLGEVFSAFLSALELDQSPPASTKSRYLDRT